MRNRIGDKTFAVEFIHHVLMCPRSFDKANFRLVELLLPSVDCIFGKLAFSLAKNFVEKILSLVDLGAKTHF